MENKYVKQYPDLMAGKKVMYVHGFGSSAQTGTVSRLRTVMCNATVIAEDMPLHPQEAIELLHRMCEEEHPDLIIGTSMGGMYTEQLYGYDRIVINPAFRIADTMAQHGLTGAQTFFNPRKDGVQKFFVDNNMVKEYRRVSEQCFSHVTDEERQRVWGLFGDCDTTVDTWDLFRQHYPTAIHFHGEHRMDDKSYMHGVMPIIRWIDDRQEGRQRPVLLITLDSAKDAYGEPRSSMQKAFRRLIETYDVHLVAPADFNDRTAMADAMAWAEKHLDAPSYNHLSFENNPAMLLGDYLVSTTPCKNFMGTVIPFGSDTFKTWEEVITYFDRLGGQ
ncbi:MAG: esterase [Prevotella sp.]|nr:esterase [Prevotella sp.]